jgi:hypothetical protein
MAIKAVMTMLTTSYAAQSGIPRYGSYAAFGIEATRIPYLVCLNPSPHRSGSSRHLASDGRNIITLHHPNVLVASFSPMPHRKTSYVATLTDMQTDITTLTNPFSTSSISCEQSLLI